MVTGCEHYQAMCTLTSFVPVERRLTVCTSERTNHVHQDRVFLNFSAHTYTLASLAHNSALHYSAICSYFSVHTYTHYDVLYIQYIVHYSKQRGFFCRIWFWVQEAPSETEHPHVEQITVYGSTVLLGAGGSTLLVTSLSMVADLIGSTVVHTVYTIRQLSDT